MANRIREEEIPRRSSNDQRGYTRIRGRELARTKARAHQVSRHRRKRSTLEIKDKEMINRF